MVEVALIIPVFLAMIFAIMEFSYAATQNAEIRHAAEEGACAAAVGQAAGPMICGSLVVVDGATYSFAGGQDFPNGGTMRILQVTAPYQSLTGLVPSGTVSSEHSVYVEPQFDPPAGGSSC